MRRLRVLLRIFHPRRGGAWRALAASHPPSCPAQSCEVPTTLRMSGLTTASVTFPTIRLRTSPTPIGRTPGCLSSAISLQAVNALRLFGSTSSVLIRLASRAIAVHRSDDLPLKAVHIRCHAAASSPDGPALPVHLSAAACTASDVMSLKITGWNSGGSTSCSCYSASR